jgi:hypothetical protein
MAVSVDAMASVYRILAGVITLSAATARGQENSAVRFDIRTNCGRVPWQDALMLGLGTLGCLVLWLFLLWLLRRCQAHIPWQTARVGWPALMVAWGWGAVGLAQLGGAWEWMFAVIAVPCILLNYPSLMLMALIGSIHEFFGWQQGLAASLVAWAGAYLSVRAVECRLAKIPRVPTRRGDREVSNHAEKSDPPQPEGES